MQARQFYNFTDSEFKWKYDGIEYTFPPKSTVYLEDYKADHFTKHLVDQEMNRLQIVTNNLTERARLEALCTPAAEPVTPAEAFGLNETAKAPKKAKKVDEFEDLKIKPKTAV